MTREAFLAERRSGIGGSDIDHLFSLEPYGCALRLWNEKRGIVPDKEIETAGVLARGQKLEALVADEYAEKTGRQVREQGVARLPEYPYLLVHIDRAVDKPGVEDEAESGVLECKTAGRQVFYQMKREGLPDAYTLQLQHAMFVTGAKWGSFAILWPDAWQLIWFDVEADATLQKQVFDEALIFWAKVQNGPAPGRLPLESPQCQRCPYAQSCQGSALERLVQLQGTGTVRDASLAPLVREYTEAKAIFDEAEEYLDGVKEEIKASMGDRVLVEVPGAGKIHFKPNFEWNVALLEQHRPDLAQKFRVKWDLTALGKAHPELEKQFKRVGTVRPLRIYPSK